MSGLNHRPSCAARWLLCAVCCLLCVQSFAQRRYNLHRRHIAHAHYSGITPLGADRYAVV
ncbi:MAG: hypothetical protein HUK03_09200, partial [Bacteroidaceae bacterium]|nr:hypothetical protein [Bacteroidaceae bacterium]